MKTSQVQHLCRKAAPFQHPVDSKSAKMAWKHYDPTQTRHKFQIFTVSNCPLTSDLKCICGKKRSRGGRDSKKYLIAVHYRFGNKRSGKVGSTSKTSAFGTMCCLFSSVMQTNRLDRQVGVGQNRKIRNPILGLGFRENSGKNGPVFGKPIDKSDPCAVSFACPFKLSISLSEGDNLKEN